MPEKRNSLKLIIPRYNYEYHAIRKIPRQNYENQNKKTNDAGIMKIMKFIEFHVRITKIKKINYSLPE